ncbi:hypothetical protein PR048_012489 [Dryococelus australis]|uniref:Retrovirus-related Pol polyprotein from transposon TNT 1-94-like beta-barrel domain-containing protein n=1 Tax=Dryococelus australis TaxID=614101 RepID=A0ABQ9HPT5_9NEOP|nr:hypothetical protein PR048_012489 [Dryococelus australis]
MHTEDNAKGPRPNREYRVLCINAIGQIAMVCPKVTTEGKNNKTKPDHKRSSSSSYTSKGARTAKVEHENTTLDEDATHHMTPYRELIKDFDGSLIGTVKLANGGCATAKGKGKVTLIITEKCGGWTIQLSDVIYNPEIENNLMS